jgi:hypothetical protein
MDPQTALVVCATCWSLTGSLIGLDTTQRTYNPNEGGYASQAACMAQAHELIAQSGQHLRWTCKYTPPEKQQ